MDDALTKTYSKLLEIRERQDLTLRPLRYLKPTYTFHDGSERPLSIRYYQVQGILHLILMARFVLGDDTGVGKSLEAIVALCYLWEKNPQQKVIILTDMSAVWQWVAEIARFTTGVHALAYMGDPMTGVKRAQRDLPALEKELKALPSPDTGEEKQKYKALKAKVASLRKLAKRNTSIQDREDIRQEFENHEGPCVLVMNYEKARVDINALQGWKDYILVCDECQAFKSPESQIHQVAAYLASRSKRTWGLTATLIQNRLLEGYGIYKVIMPGLFGSKNDFQHDYSIVEMVWVGQNRKIPKVVGHSPEHVKRFKEAIDPYYVGRAKWQVATELPSLTIKSMECRLTPWQEAKYDETLAGILEMADGDVKETTMLTQIGYCQQICNHPQVLGFDEESPKLDLLIDLLTTGEFAGVKAIVSSRSKKMVHLIVAALKAKKVKSVTVTGDDSAAVREKNKNLFQDTSSGVDVICITDAGKQAINLQAAQVIIFFDTDFSGGVYLQKLGRMIRIGSEHDTCYAVHLVAKRAHGGKTVDHRCMDILNTKMDLIEAVLGKRIKGEGDEAGIIREDNDITQLFASLREDAKKARENA